ncbi:hypothetical protein F5Y15DRAFT_428630 [Xylariaceae sp. FL0016]|nr:hypothetical protein F5Y15DRAFT_428630 [Xylariaceae sp. FL0016]
MDLDIYWITLVVLTPVVALTAGRGIIARVCTRWWHPGQQQRSRLSRGEAKDSRGDDDDDDDDKAAAFRVTFFRVYLLVMGSEWLQGPFTYSLFRHEKALPEATVAALYVAFYAAAAASAPLMGWLADWGGRRRACLGFCGAHGLASLSVLADDVAVLVVGRALGGVALALLWTAFESWMIAEYGARGLGWDGGDGDDGDDGDGDDGDGGGDGLALGGLGNMFGLMTTLNCITAIVAGVLGHCVVLALGSKTDPFVVGVALDIGAAVLIIRTWNENYGDSRNKGQSGGGGREEERVETSGVDGQVVMGGGALRRTKTKVWILSFVTCCFEGTVFLLMFFWPGTLQAARDEARSDPGPGPDLDHGSSLPIPHGVIFAAFMAVMVLGALFFNLVNTSSRSPPSGPLAPSTKPSRPTRAFLFTPTQLLAGALFVGAGSFLLAAFARSEAVLFAAFLVFEGCNGIYVPSIAYVRGVVVAEAGRARIYGLMNIPLFLFVVVAIGTTGTEGGEHKQLTFMICAALLFVAALATVLGLGISGQMSLGFEKISPPTRLESGSLDIGVGLGKQPDVAEEEVPLSKDL